MKIKEMLDEYAQVVQVEGYHSVAAGEDRAKIREYVHGLLQIIESKDVEESVPLGNFKYQSALRALTYFNARIAVSGVAL
jgi:hypothetical protein